MSEAIKVRSFREIRAEVDRLKAALVDDCVIALNMCYLVRDQALAAGDETLAWRASTEASAIVAATRAAKASLTRFVEHLEAAAKS